MKRSLLIILAVALLVSGALETPAQAGGVSGAIFTTDVFGTVVNGNQYASKCDVYLDGGPGPNAPANAAGLPDGDYHFQVTDPSGAHLLSTDPISNRQFTVTGGVITAYLGSHPTGMDQDHMQAGAITIGLADTDCPADYLDTPNNGGVYKVWVTPIADYIDPELCRGGCFHGFVSSKSKTDNFKVLGAAADPTFCLTAIKELEQQGEFQPYAGWIMTVTNQAATTNTSLPTTDPDGEARFCGLTAGSYIVTEETRPDIVLVELLVNGMTVLPTKSVIIEWEVGEREPVVLFRNGAGLM
jgi:hypothetical protein